MKFAVIAAIFGVALTQQPFNDQQSSWIVAQNVQRNPQPQVNSQNNDKRQNQWAINNTPSNTNFPSFERNNFKQNRDFPQRPKSAPNTDLQWGYQKIQSPVIIPFYPSNRFNNFENTQNQRYNKNLQSLDKNDRAQISKKFERKQRNDIRRRDRDDDSDSDDTRDFNQIRGWRGFEGPKNRNHRRFDRRDRRRSFSRDSSDDNDFRRGRRDFKNGDFNPKRMDDRRGKGRQDFGKRRSYSVDNKFERFQNWNKDNSKFQQFQQFNQKPEINQRSQQNFNQNPQQNMINFKPQFQQPQFQQPQVMNQNMRPGNPNFNQRTAPVQNTPFLSLQDNKNSFGRQNQQGRFNDVDRDFRPAALTQAPKTFWFNSLRN